jgi:ribosomal protein S18 acetylase RimI-like enzyme
VKVAWARFPEDLETVRALFREYRQTPGVAECVAGFEEERAGRPGRYGALLLGRVDGVPRGVAALRPREPGVCEMKRLYVQPAARGAHLGRRLAEALIAEARAQGFGQMRLDTSPSMTAAIARYYEAAPAAALFFELKL